MSGTLEPAAAELLRSLGRRIRQVRLERGLSPVEVAAVVGLAPAQLAAVEDGQVEIAVDDLFRIAAALGMTAAELIAPIDS